MTRDQAMALAQSVADALESDLCLVTHGRDCDEVAITFFGISSAYTLGQALQLAPGQSEVTSCTAYATQDDANDPDELPEPAIRILWRY